jgi:hypothetical protein
VSKSFAIGPLLATLLSHYKYVLYNFDKPLKSKKIDLIVVGGGLSTKPQAFPLTERYFEIQLPSLNPQPDCECEGETMNGFLAA